VSVGTVVRSLARWIGIVAIFSVAGPLAVVALITLIMVGFGAPLLQLMVDFVNIDALRTIVSVAVWLLVVATLLASFPPSAAAGLIFASVAVCAGFNAVWMAWVAAAVAIIGFVVLGVFVIPAESSALILPSVQSARQAFALFVVLAGIAILPTTLCWWLAKPLHRANIAA
jgi:hypothetical protein